MSALKTRAPYDISDFTGCWF